MLESWAWLELNKWLVVQMQLWSGNFYTAVRLETIHSSRQAIAKESFLRLVTFGKCACLEMGPPQMILFHSIGYICISGQTPGHFQTHPSIIKYQFKYLTTCETKMPILGQTSSAQKGRTTKSLQNLERDQRSQKEAPVLRSQNTTSANTTLKKRRQVTCTLR